LGSGDVDGGTGGVGEGGGDAHLGTSARYGQVGIAIDREDQGLALSEGAIVVVVGVDGVGLAGAVGDGDGQAGEGQGIGAGTVGAGDLADIGSVEAEGDLGEGTGARGVEHDLGDGEGVGAAGVGEGEVEDIDGGL
jgi:hypothetical protein